MPRDSFSVFDEEPDEQRAELDRDAWAKERRRRAHICTYGLPPFATPTYKDLRRLYRAYRADPEIRTLILEIQCGRYAFSELAALAGECYWDVTKPHASIEDARKAFARLRSRLRKELDRIGQIHARK